MDILPDLFFRDLKVIFCGTAPGKTSAGARAYYAHPRNRFWPILSETRLITADLQPHEFKRLREWQIGLTDLCKTASGNDDQLPKGALEPSRLKQSIIEYRPRFIGFTSKTAGRAFLGRTVEYGWQTSFHESRIYVLPTTSPRWGIEWWNEKKGALA